MTNVVLPSNTYVDLYASTGIAVGLSITVTSITPRDVSLYYTAAAPTPADEHVNLSYGVGSYTNDAGDPGAWALCVISGAVDVKLAL
jgi:hypothetical protein